MKKFRSTLIYLGLVALVGGYIYFFERGPVKPKDDDAAKKEKVFADFVADDIREIRLENIANTRTAERTSIDIQKNDKDVWQVVAPQKYTADETMVRNMLTGAGGFNPESTIDNPANLADFGLNSPTAHCTFFPKKGQPFDLFIGDKNPTGSSYYTKTGGKNTLYLLTVYSIDPYRKALNDYRDRSFFKTDSVLAQKVQVTYQGKTFLLEKGKDNNWNITEPFEAKADDSKVRDLLNQVNNLRVTDFVEDHPARLGIYGLATPKAKVEVWPADKGPSRAILIGREKLKANSIFAKDRDLSYVYTIPSVFAKNLDIKPDDYRDKTMMRFDAGSVKALMVQHNGKSFAYQKDDKGQWTAEGRPKAQEEAANLVGQLAGTTISNFATKKAETGLEDPSFTVKVGLTDGTSRTFRFGKREKDQVYLASDRNSDIYLVAAGVAAQMEVYFSNIMTPVPVSSPVPAVKK